MVDAAHFLESSLREKIVEHLFLGELLRCLWLKGSRGIEVLRAEVDNGGYDLGLECDDAWRHVQLKASRRAAKTNRVPVNMNLTRKPSGCVIWVLFDSDSLELGPYFWLGGSPRNQLTDGDLGLRLGRHTRADSRGVKHERPNIRMVPRTKFTRLAAISNVADMLFGVP